LNRERSASQRDIDDVATGLLLLGKAEKEYGVAVKPKMLAADLEKADLARLRPFKNGRNG
jgi:hypothetical protein